VGKNVLAPWAPIPPNIPHRFPILLSHLLNLFACEPFIIPIIPFANVFCDFNTSFGSDLLAFVAMSLPREGGFAAKMEEFDGSLGTVSRGYIAIIASC
jgi:hypothetical protein